MNLRISDKLTNEQKHVLILVIFFMLTLGIFSLIIYPTVRYIQGVNQETLQLRTYMERKYETMMRPHTSKEKIDNIKNQVGTYPAFLFKHGDELNLITLLENIAAKNNVEQKINGANLDKTAGQQVNLDVTISGKYNDVLAYINNLEHSDYFFNLASISLSQNTARDANKVSVTVAHINILLYVNQ